MKKLKLCLSRNFKLSLVALMVSLQSPHFAFASAADWIAPDAVRDLSEALHKNGLDSIGTISVSWDSLRHSGPLPEYEMNVFLAVSLCSTIDCKIVQVLPQLNWYTSSSIDKILTADLAIDHIGYFLSDNPMYNQFLRLTLIQRTGLLSRNKIIARGDLIPLTELLMNRRAVYTLTDVMNSKLDFGKATVSIIPKNSDK
jgi:hypothetical protein